MKGLRLVPPIPEGFERIARGREAHPGLPWKRESNPGRGCSDPSLRTPAGVRLPKGHPFPGCVLRTTRGYLLQRLRRTDSGIRQLPSVADVRRRSQQRDRQVSNGDTATRRLFGRLTPVATEYGGRSGTPHGHRSSQQRQRRPQSPVRVAPFATVVVERSSLSLLCVPCVLCGEPSPGLSPSSLRLRASAGSDSPSASPPKPPPSPHLEELLRRQSRSGQDVTANRVARHVGEGTLQARRRLQRAGERKFHVSVGLSGDGKGRNT